MKNLLKGNYDEAGQEAQDNIPQLVSYFIAALIGLALLLLFGAHDTVTELELINGDTRLPGVRLEHSC